MVSYGVLAWSSGGVQVRVGLFLDGLFYLLERLADIVLVLSLDVQVLLSVAQGRLFAHLHLHSPLRYRAVCALLNPMQEASVGDFVPRICWVVVDLEVVAEGIRAVRSLLVYKLFDEVLHLHHSSTCSRRLVFPY